MAYQQRAAQLFWRAVEDPDFLQSVRSHQRYPLRLVAIISAAFGLFFNLLTVCLGQHKALNGIAFIPVRRLLKHLPSS